MALNIALNQIKDLNLHLAYEGIVTSDNVESILDLIKTNMPIWLPNSSSGKASRLAVECLQNIVRHAHGGTAYVMIYHRDKIVNMQCRNVVTLIDKQKLEQNYKLLESYNPETYQQMYRDQLKNAHFNERGGAGIGLFDMAYRMGKLPQYKLEPTEQTGLYYYTLTIVLTQTI